MDHVIDPPPRPALPALGGGAFPVRRIWCVGRNYAAHAAEMGNDARDPPFFFAKPGDAAVPCPAEGAPAQVPYPPDTADLHHEVELVVAIGRMARDVAPQDVRAHLWGAAVGVDLTRRDRQAEAKAASRPWDLAKGFDASAPIGPIAPLGGFDPARGRIRLDVNGETRQDADLSDMIWPVAEHVSILSRSVALMPGDLVMTGTPAGVGPLAAGDLLHGRIDGLPDLLARIAPAA
jgi:fumarylpyruvate hydrolase